MAHFEVITVIAASTERCFDLSLNVEAHASSMARSGEKVIGGVASGRMALGDSVTWQARHFGIPFRMTSSITEWEPPARFVDEQVKGPFARWWHEHRFEQEGRETRMTDRVSYRAPAGLIGSAVDRAVLARYMRDLILERNAWLKATLERDG
ncbi:SRPBCC family protein [Phycicoccus sp. MAQZ13P-2]|uniref:SRPBCC family protein n=1 Tax=Phycicoccus mangrovi TaxID=2840470 RepID=UPI001C0001AD|nr:SRPBCC family protein [Phycicoccus mangrovi]MBT9256276.1 SRPBCC family protein [Phycicoccus mangrovi]MBT9273607.1 SRPBCC family protein [Phycicoccus mangrovi]